MNTIKEYTLTDFEDIDKRIEGWQFRCYIADKKIVFNEKLEGYFDSSHSKLWVEQGWELPLDAEQINNIATYLGWNDWVVYCDYHDYEEATLVLQDKEYAQTRVEKIYEIIEEED